MNRGKIIIVDDDPAIQKLIKNYFELSGYDVLCVKNCRNALSEIESESFDIVITDYSMPDMNGLELTRFIKQVNPLLPVIGVSAAGYGKQFFDAGADSFLRKPFELKILREVVEKCLKSLQ